VIGWKVFSQWQGSRGDAILVRKPFIIKLISLGLNFQLYLEIIRHTFNKHFLLGNSHKGHSKGKTTLRQLRHNTRAPLALLNANAQAPNYYSLLCCYQLICMGATCLCEFNTAGVMTRTLFPRLSEIVPLSGQTANHPLLRAADQYKCAPPPARPPAAKVKIIPQLYESRCIRGKTQRASKLGFWQRFRASNFCG
jgi:hypothetical protein